MPLYWQSEPSTNGLNALAPEEQAVHFTYAAGFNVYCDVCCKLCGGLHRGPPLLVFHNPLAYLPFSGK